MTSTYDKDIKNNESAAYIGYEINFDQDYSLVKPLIGKKCYNIKKDFLRKHKHNKIDYFVVLPKNSYPQNFFGGSTNYLDYELPKLPNHTFGKFVLSYTITNNSLTDSAWLNIGPLQIERISLLINSNALGSDITDQMILFHNLQRNCEIDGLSNDGANFAQEFNLHIANGNFSSVSNLSSWGTCTTGITLPATYHMNYKIELPISLSESEIVSNSIKDVVVIRVYFKKTISIPKQGTNAGNPVLDTQITLSNCQLYLRLNELSRECLKRYYGQPKINHIFNKTIVNKYIINQLSTGQEQSIVLNSFSSITSGCWIFLTDPDSFTLNNTWNSNAYGKPLPYFYQWAINNVFITNSVGINILNGINYDQDYNRYVLQEHFGVLSAALEKLCYNGYNNGFIYYIPFCGNGEDSVFKNEYNGAIAFDGNAKLHFSGGQNASSSPLVVNIIFNVPSNLELVNGSLLEIYPN